MEKSKTFSSREDLNKYLKSEFGLAEKILSFCTSFLLIIIITFNLFINTYLLALSPTPTIAYVGLFLFKTLFCIFLLNGLLGFAISIFKSHHLNKIKRKEARNRLIKEIKKELRKKK